MPNQQTLPRSDVVVVGAGSAGLYAALTAAREGARTLLISQAPLASTASYWAQGGIAAAIAGDDSIEAHQHDTLAAGRRAGRASAARVLVRDAPIATDDLTRLRIEFDRGPRGDLSLGLEGGHSHRRVVHAGGSATGRRITRELSARVAEQPFIEVIEHASARALITLDDRCVGIQIVTGSGEVALIPARCTILATGGLAALWARSTNPPAAVGSGLAMAHAAGADLADLEFLQFHPTALVSATRNQGFLITEAIRGEGATLIDERGERFVDELAPRDLVASSIEGRRQGTDGQPPSKIFLDMREIDPHLFPNVFTKIGEAGIDPRREPVPVAPAAHYGMGGIVTDLNARTSLAGLFAVGECACTGLHGANRLASNSLAECLVFGRRAALAALAEPAPAPGAIRHVSDHGGDAPVADADPNPGATRDLLWRCAGIERDATRLAELAASPNILARLIGASAIARRETRGAHHRIDFPDTDPALDFQHFIVNASGVIDRRRWE